MESDENRTTLRHIAVTRSARYAVLGAVDPRVREMWIVCHGYAQLATRFIERFRAIASPERLIVAPEALSRFYTDRGAGFHGAASQVGATWMTAEDRDAEILDYIRYLDALYAAVLSRLGTTGVSVRALGFSQGASTVARWIAAGNSPVDQVIIWAGSIPPELTGEGAKKLMAGGRPVVIVAGEQDQFITPKVLKSQVTLLSELGVPSRVVTFAGGHEVDSTTLEAIAGDFSPISG